MEKNCNRDIYNFNFHLHSYLTVVCNLIYCAVITLVIDDNIKPGRRLSQSNYFKHVFVL